MAHGLSRALSGFPHAAEGVEVLRVVEPEGDSEGNAQVHRTHDTAVHPLHGHDGVDTVDRFGGLDDREIDHGVVDPGGVFLFEQAVPRGAVRPPSPRAARGIAAGVGPGLRFLRGVHEGDDDPHGAHVEVQLDQVGVGAGDPDDRRGRRAARGLDLRLHGHRRLGRVLRVDQDPVVTGQSGQFRDGGGAEPELCADGGLAFVQEVPEAAAHHEPPAVTSW